MDRWWVSPAIPVPYIIQYGLYSVSQYVIMPVFELK